MRRLKKLLGALIPRNAAKMLSSFFAFDFPLNFAANRWCHQKKIEECNILYYAINYVNYCAIYYVSRIILFTHKALAGKPRKGIQIAPTRSFRSSLRVCAHCRLHAQAATTCLSVCPYHGDVNAGGRAVSDVRLYADRDDRDEGIDRDRRPERACCPVTAHRDSFVLD